VGLKGLPSNKGNPSTQFGAVSSFEVIYTLKGGLFFVIAKESLNLLGNTKMLNFTVDKGILEGGDSDSISVAQFFGAEAFFRTLMTRRILEEL
jgi:hypothetical protein